MPGHFSVRDEDYFGQVASIAQTKGIPYPDKKALEMFASCYGEGAERLSDADAVSPAFLIRHIDRAFEQRTKFPWLRDIDDETFFEYLLPYRFLNEPLDYWRDSLTIAPQAFSDMISCDNLKYDPAAVASHVYTDRDPLTYVRYVRDNKKEMVIDLKSLVGITRIVCVPRNDGNSVFPGSVYELFYYGMDGWESLGIKRAEDYNVEYEDVPAGALYWLKCLTGGVEERIFTFTDKDGIRFF